MKKFAKIPRSHHESSKNPNASSKNTIWVESARLREIEQKLLTSILAAKPL
jgi:hypothetical protein